MQLSCCCQPSLIRRLASKSHRNSTMDYAIVQNLRILLLYSCHSLQQKAVRFRRFLLAGSPCMLPGKLRACNRMALLGLGRVDSEHHPSGVDEFNYGEINSSTAARGQNGGVIKNRFTQVKVQLLNSRIGEQQFSFISVFSYLCELQSRAVSHRSFSEDIPLLGNSVETIVALL